MTLDILFHVPQSTVSIPFVLLDCVHHLFVLGGLFLLLLGQQSLHSLLRRLDLSIECILDWPWGWGSWMEALLLPVVDDSGNGAV